MIAHSDFVRECTHVNSQKYGKNRSGSQRYKCKECGATWTEARFNALGEMRLDIRDAARAIQAMCERVSIRATSRITGVSKKSLLRLILQVGESCGSFLASKVQGIEVEDVQIDELWSFVKVRGPQFDPAKHDEESEGEFYTFIGIERNTKLVLAHRVGKRDKASTKAFLYQLKKSIGEGVFQLSSDALNSYNDVPRIFGRQVRFGQLVKDHIAPPSSRRSHERYRPNISRVQEKRSVYNDPDWDKICTSHIERFNGTMRDHLARFTRLTKAHSVSIRHHCAMQSLFFAWFNFCRPHMSLNEGRVKRTPAMASGITDHVWGIEELVTSSAMATVTL